MSPRRDRTTKHTQFPKILFASFILHYSIEYETVVHHFGLVRALVGSASNLAPSWFPSFLGAEYSAKVISVWRTKGRMISNLCYEYFCNAFSSQFPTSLHDSLYLPAVSATGPTCEIKLWEAFHSTRGLLFGFQLFLLLGGMRLVCGYKLTGFTC